MAGRGTTGARGRTCAHSVEGTERSDAAAVGQRLELDGLRVADELCCLGLHLVEEGEGRGRGAEPDGAAVFHAGADVGLVDGRQRRAGDHVTRAPQVPVC